jgi:hypothetical protein
LLMLAVASSAETQDIPVDTQLVATEMDSEWFTYCSGSPGWLSWEGTYRGTWFHLEEFYPGVTNGFISEVELWFYHNSSYPWDTSDVYVEVWGGDSSGPVNLLDQQMVTALHMTPVYVYYDPPLEVPDDFWVLLNTEMSAGGWPSILGDDSEEPVAHSFYSNDHSLWEPWLSGRNYFISVLADCDELSGISWGELKSLF